MSKLYRSRRDKKITGLCGGLAETLNVDATLLRLLLVITTLFSGGTVIFIYVLAAIVIPKEPGFEPPYDPYAGPYGRPPYQGGGWNPPPRPPSGPARPDPYAGAYEANKGSHIDEMMKDIEKKALQREIEELRKKVAHYENKNDKSKGDV